MKYAYVFKQSRQAWSKNISENKTGGKTKLH